MKKYLESSKYIDWQHPSILKKAHQLASENGDRTPNKDKVNQEEIAKACFLFVRDEIKHSWDYQMNPVTCKASDVLKYQTGFCFAKSHLLAALLRANNIPAGLCYQRLTIDDDQPPLSLHGLNAVYLQNYGWYRVDARGNKENVDSNFCPPQEQLAYPIIHQQEADLPEIWSKPLPIIIEALEGKKDYLEVANNLPDIQLIPR